MQVTRPAQNRRLGNHAEFGLRPDVSPNQKRLIG